MRSRILLFIFVILFAGQTIASVYDEHAPHQSNASHNSNIEHNSNTASNKHQESVISLLDITSNDASLNDCHHCCHCHTPTSATLFSIVSDLNFPFYHLKSIINNVSAESALISPEHRPPIA